ncbi:uncharacterized protein LAJ45_07796 [Morchella importuna]|uniref:uncharacterized protein n=1 Tax=Morchella importuna TaxID=1174673 RepID=UPI001E8CC446|nr:uncharacterized protein LAJ45_07796 [Morchella importuna]KAH8148032.1 hypothetical protein LAJ45_07796 [Morchella importuna]
MEPPWGSGGRGGVRDREWAVFRVGHFLSGGCYQHISVISKGLERNLSWLILGRNWGGFFGCGSGFDAKSL